MKTFHPKRKHSIAYLLTIVMLVLLFFVLGLHGAHMPDQNSHQAHVYGTLSGAYLVLAVIFFIPFIYYAYKNWRIKISNSELPPPDNMQHELNSTFSTSLLALIVGNIFAKKGTLIWNNQEKIVKLVSKDADEETIIFESSYSAIKKLEVSLNMVVIHVNGKRFALFPSNVAIAATTYAGLAANSQFASIALGSQAMIDSGLIDFAERLVLEGVDVIVSDIKRAIEVGFVSGFIALFTISTLWAVYIVQ